MPSRNASGRMRRSTAACAPPRPDLQPKPPEAVGAQRRAGLRTCTACERDVASPRLPLRAGGRARLVGARGVKEQRGVERERHPVHVKRPERKRLRSNGGHAVSCKPRRGTGRAALGSSWAVGVGLPRASNRQRGARRKLRVPATQLGRRRGGAGRGGAGHGRRSCEPRAVYRCSLSENVREPTGGGALRTGQPPRGHVTTPHITLRQG
jgi:hypothetical protein